MDALQKEIFLSDFQILEPKFFSTQESGSDWIASAYAKVHPERTFEEHLKLVTRFGCKPQQIKTRRHELPDFTHKNWDEMQIFNLNQFKEGANLTARMQFFEQASDRIFNQAYANVTDGPAHLFHVSCTGYISPSSAQKTVVDKNWATQTTVTHVYHMGCYAAMPAIRLAVGALQSAEHQSTATRSVNARADIVHTEFCTLHFNPNDLSPEQMVVQTLFADGCIRYSAARSKPKTTALKILQLREELIPNSKEAMTWAPAHWGMKMSLARDVPEKIKGALEGFLERLFQQADLDFHQEKRTCHFAVHPGGPRILDFAKEALGLEEEQISRSRKVLLERGNMSSATLPHVWAELCNNNVAQSLPGKKLVASLAFGPGLTVCGALFQAIV